MVWTERRGDGLVLRVDSRVYSEEAIFRACYIFTDRCYLLLDRDGSDHIIVRFRARQESATLDQVVGEFANELLNQRLRIGLARETKQLRERIVAQAFAGTDVDAT
jgi:His-Xaa-Ser system protein HxsD